MIGEYIRIEVGMILKVEKSFLVKENGIDEVFTEKRRIKKGSIIEIRYPFEWNFRTVCNTYCNATPDLIREKCSLYGMIFDDVRFENKLKLSDILRDNLFHTPDRFKLVSLKLKSGE